MDDKQMHKSPYSNNTTQHNTATQLDSPIHPLPLSLPNQPSFASPQSKINIYHKRSACVRACVRPRSEFDVIIRTQTEQNNSKARRAKIKKSTTTLAYNWVEEVGELCKGSNRGRKTSPCRKLGLSPCGRMGRNGDVDDDASKKNGCHNCLCFCLCIVTIHLRGLKSNKRGIKTVTQIIVMTARVRIICKKKDEQVSSLPHPKQ